MVVEPLWHYTCEHGHAALGASGFLLSVAAQVPRKKVPWWGRLIWLTDMTPPMKEALGLTAISLRCDRTAHRYRVTDLDGIAPWTEFAKELPPGWRYDLEGEPGSRPVHWYVAINPVPVTYDPLGAPA